MTDMPTKPFMDVLTKADARKLQRWWSRKGVFEIRRSPSNRRYWALYRMDLTRRNPTLVILSNPERVPGEQTGRRAWGKFHLKSGEDAKIQAIPDIPGMPRTLVVLGALEGIEWVRSPDEGPAREIRFRRSPQKGPWLVTDTSCKRLWIVSTTSLTRLPASGYVKAVHYYPGGNSGKYHPKLAFRHVFGEGRHPESRWPNFYPYLSGSGRKRVLERPTNGFTIEDRGIVG